jgi:hypothetical protein
MATENDYRIPLMPGLAFAFLLTVVGYGLLYIAFIRFLTWGVNTEIHPVAMKELTAEEYPYPFWIRVEGQVIPNSRTTHNGAELVLVRDAENTTAAWVQTQTDSPLLKPSEGPAVIQGMTAPFPENKPPVVAQLPADSKLATRLLRESETPPSFWIGWAWALPGLPLFFTGLTVFYHIIVETYRDTFGKK